MALLPILYIPLPTSLVVSNVLRALIVSGANILPRVDLPVFKPVQKSLALSAFLRPLNISLPALIPLVSAVASANLLAHLATLRNLFAPTAALSTANAAVAAAAAV